MINKQLIKSAQLWQEVAQHAPDQVRAYMGREHYYPQMLGFKSYDEFAQKARQHGLYNTSGPINTASTTLPTELLSDGQGGNQLQNFFRDEQGNFRWDKYKSFHNQLPEISQRLKKNRYYLNQLQGADYGQEGQTGQLFSNILQQGYDPETNRFSAERMFKPLRTLRENNVYPSQISAASRAMSEGDPVSGLYSWVQQGEVPEDMPWSKHPEAAQTMYRAAQQLGMAPDLPKGLEADELSGILSQAREAGLTPQQVGRIADLRGTESISDLYGQVTQKGFPTGKIGQLYDMARKYGLLKGQTGWQPPEGLSGQDVQKLVEAGQDIGLTPDQIESLQQNIGKATNWSRALGGKQPGELGSEYFIKQLRGPEGDISSKRVRRAHQATSQLERLPGVEQMKEKMGPEAFQRGIDLIQSFGSGQISNYVDDGKLNLKKLEEDIRVGGQALQSMQKAEQMSSFLASDDVEEMRQSGVLQDVMSAVASGEDTSTMGFLKKRFVGEDGTFDQQAFTRFLEKGGGIAKAAGELHDDLLDQGEGDKGAFSRQQLERMGIDPGEMASRYLKSTGEGKEMDLEAAGNEIKFWNNVVDTFEGADPAFKKRVVNTMEMVNRLGGIGFLGKGKDLARDAMGFFFDEQGNLEHPQLLGAATRLGSAAETLYTKLIEERDPKAWLGTLVGAAGILWGLKRLFGLGGDEEPARRPQDINVTVQQGGRRPQQTQPASLTSQSESTSSMLSGLSPQQQLKLLRDTRNFL